MYGIFRLEKPNVKIYILVGGIIYTDKYKAEQDLNAYKTVCPEIEYIVFKLSKVK